MTDSATISVTIPSDTSRGLEVQERILALITERGFSTRDVFSVRIGLEEAIVNAVKHGNGLDPDKSVKIHCEVTEDRIRIIIEDEGEGFDPNDVPDPTDLENLDKSSGRGLMLMRHYLDIVEYNQHGNQVTIEKRKSAPEAES